MDDLSDIVSPEDRSLTPSERKHALKNWRGAFLAALADTSNVTASASQVFISLGHVYRVRKEDPEFARQWLEALCEGYDNLEMELLYRMRSGESRDPDGVKYDNATAIRLLGQHRANAERGRALRENDDEQAVLDSIDAVFCQMRERAAANAAILAAYDTEDTAHAGS